MAVLLHGDCLEVMKTLPDKSVDLFLCDLPYGCLTPHGATPFGRNTKGPLGEGCAWDIKLDLAQFWTQVKRLCKDDHTPVLMFCSTKFGFDLYASNPDWFRYDLVWNKMCGVSFLSANKMPMRSHEMIYVFAKKGATYTRTDIAGDFPKWLVGKNGVRSGNHADAGLPKANISGGDGTRCVLSVIECKTARSNQKGEKKEHKHPTQKPDDLYEWLITRYSKPGDTVLDPTAGSFASVFTAERLGRHGIGIEKDEGFYAKALSLHPTTHTPPQ
jgi:site-specific DNA-methyltransferase (adenine-specific)